MSRTVYVNGEYLPEEQAKISIFDRAFLFADGVYEVSAVIDGALVDHAAHTRRLHRSLSELKMPAPVSDEELLAIHESLIEKNALREGAIYMQVTRGEADRDFAFPVDATPNLVVFTQAKSLVDSPQATHGIRVITVADQRWARRDIKTVGLLGPSLAKQAAVEAGVQDAWMVEDGLVTEGTSNNAYIVNASDEVITRHLGNEILHGITRAAVLRLSEEQGINIIERPFSVDEARQAQEAFITSATSFVLPVVEIDGHPIGNGEPGPLTRRLREIYIAYARSRAG